MSDTTFDKPLQEKLAALAQRQEEVLSQMNDPAVAANHTKLIELNKELAQLRRVVDPYLKHTSCLAELRDTEELMRDKTQDQDLRDLAGAELPVNGVLDIERYSVRPSGLKLSRKIRSSSSDRVVLIFSFSGPPEPSTRRR